MHITYRHDLRPPAEEIVKLYDASPLFRPTRDVERIRRMYDGSNVVLTAWDDHRLVGILRGWTDFAYDGYVCDLAVHPDYQKRGIGRELLRRVTDHYGTQVQWVLRASKIAVDYYKHIGWEPIENGWCWRREG